MNNRYKRHHRNLCVVLSTGGKFPLSKLVPFRNNNIVPRSDALAWRLPGRILSTLRDLIIMRTAFISLAVSLAVLGTFTRAGEDKKPAAHSPNEVKLFELTNLERKKKELPPLKLNAALSKIARGHSENMARQGKMEHKLDDKTAGDRMRAAGYQFVRGGENIAAGDEAVTLPMLMKAWMESQYHRENILLAEFSEIGIGIARDKSGQLYYTQLFARPRKD